VHSYRFKFLKADPWSQRGNPLGQVSPLETWPTKSEGLIWQAVEDSGPRQERSTQGPNRLKTCFVSGQQPLVLQIKTDELGLFLES
jgi:hypothetical protein